MLEAALSKDQMNFSETIGKINLGVRYLIFSFNVVPAKDISSVSKDFPQTEVVYAVHTIKKKIILK